MRPRFKEKIIFFGRRLAHSLRQEARTAYFRFIGMQIGRGTKLPKIYCTWPHQVKIGCRCRLEHDIYFHFDGIYTPGPRITIGDRCFVGAGCEFNVRDRVEIGRDCLIAAGVRFVDHDHDISGKGRLLPIEGAHAPITLQDHVWIGANSVILKGVEVGEGAVLAAGAVLTKSVPANEVWAGVPARKIKLRL